MESYIIRIYQRDQKAPERIVGTVEFVDDQETKSFRTVSELTSILAAAPNAETR